MRRHIPHVVLLVLIAVNIAIFTAKIDTHAPGLSVSVLDIGQGDSILIQGPTGIQMLIDGGLGQKVLSKLAEEMGSIDRSIDIVVETHPDADHIGGLPAVFDRYDVSYFMEPGISSESSNATALYAAVETEQGIVKIVARRGMRIDLGGGAYADVLYPDRDPSGLETNTGSIVMRVVYGETSFMLTGDMPSEIEDWLVTLDGNRLQSDVLKVGHHGSKNSTDTAWLAAVQPSIAAISAGEGNSYGHPAPETLERIKHQGAEIYSTIEEETIRFVSDGEIIILK